MTRAVHLLARPVGPVRLLPARLRGALLRATVSLLIRSSRLDELLDLAAGRAGPAREADQAGPLDGVPAWPEVADAGPSGPGHTVGALRRLPITCLHRALAAYAVLREEGVEARFVIGVKRHDGEVQAHAWVEHAGAPVGEPTDPRPDFTVAYVHPAPVTAAEVHPAPTMPGSCLQEVHMAPTRTSPDVLLTKLADGSGVLLHLRTKFYYALNQTGVVAWEALSGREPADLEAIVELLVARFEGIERARARADLQALLADLEAEGLLAPGR